ncbi:MAG: exopolysaccharide biosynthesis protein [Pirellulaceae bacterium]|nr:exopolysaccharide biosynthesis protein [Pirellulaceae bacterium]
MYRNPTDLVTSTTLADLVGSIRRRIGSVIVTGIVLSVLLAVLVMAWPNRYVSDGMMYVRLGRGALAVDPTAQGAKTISLMESRQSEVISIAKMLSGREIAERTAKQVGVEEINRPRHWVDKAKRRIAKVQSRLGSATIGSEGPRDQADGLSSSQYAEQIQLENAVKKVQNWVDVSIPKEGHTVSVFGQGTDPVLVQTIVQTLMDEYQRYHVEAHQAKGSLKFFEQQVAESRMKATEAERALQDAKSEMGWLSAASAEDAMKERIVRLELLRDEAQSAYADAQSHANALKNRLAELEQWVPTEVTKGIASQAGDNMRTAFYEKQVESSEAIAKLKPTHPRYKMMQKVMSQSQSILDAEGKEREETLEAINPIYQSVQSEYEVTMAKAAGLKSRFDTLSESVQRAQQDMVRMNSDAVTLSNLKWQSEIAQQNYLAHAKSLEESRIADELDAQQMSDVAVIQNASLNLQKSGPPRLMLLVLACVVGLMIGVLQAIMRDTPVASSSARTSSEPSRADQNGGDQDADHQRVQEAEEAVAV